MAFGELEKEVLRVELEEKLPADQFHLDNEAGTVSYYDYHGVTFQEGAAEIRFADQYVIDTTSEKAGFPVRMTKWGPSNNGRFTHYFERVSEEE
jgi:hypothetical protein